MLAQILDARASNLVERRMRQAIFCTYSRSIFPSYPLLRCLHTSAFGMDYLSRNDIGGHSFRRTVCGFVPRTLVFSLHFHAHRLCREVTRIMGNSPENIDPCFLARTCVRNFLIEPSKEWYYDMLEV